MFRGFVCILFLCLDVVLLLPVALIGALVSLFGKDRQRRYYRAFVRWALKVIAKISGARLSVTGAEGFKDGDSYLFAGNHQSYFDIVLAYRYLPEPTFFVVKDEFKRIPLLGFLAKRIGCLFIDREDPRKAMKTIVEATEILKENRGSVFIYPEGTRSRDGLIHEFHSGSFKAAQKSGAPIIPVAAYGTREVWENHLSRLYPAPVKLSFLPPVNYPELSPDEKKHIGEHVRSLIEKSKERG